jgi:hypothetical protein
VGTSAPSAGTSAPSAAAAAPSAAAAAAAAVPTAAPATAESAEPEGEDVGATRAVPRPLAQLIWDDGTRVAVRARTLFGRNPPRDGGAAAIPVRDETLSLSKTHFEIGADDSGSWISDRHSTNGTVVVRMGVREQLVPGVHVPIRAGDRIEFGDRSVYVESA